MTMEKKLLSPDILFETSWEVCNKVGGIHTVLATKALTLTRNIRGRYILIGPDIQKDHHPEFDEDPNLFKQWKQQAYEEGIRIRIGRWKVKGYPVTVLVDFSSFINRKDDILKDLWEKFGVDSLYSEWDYIEPVLFGYAAGKVIENYIKYLGKPTDHVVAQFHEWMTASGGLYLKAYRPEISFIFTTHATVMGRSIAGNNMPLYQDLNNFHVEDLARRFNVIAKHSMEKIAASKADCFTTVSEITAKECQFLLNKEPDLVTPNGFENDIVWEDAIHEMKLAEARAQMIHVAEVSLGIKFEKEPMIVCTCGRYEFRNKGLDVFIDSLAALNHDPGLDREILAYILVPAGNLGPRKDLQQMLKGEPCDGEPFAVKNLTHQLRDPDHDSILTSLRQQGLLKNDGGVKVMYVPAYLDHLDGIFDKHYYEILTGVDVTVFPSYYEPWGYTPLESIAFSIPTITTSLAGFGMWIKTHVKSEHKGVLVIDRTDTNDNEVTNAIVTALSSFTAFEKEQMQQYRSSALELSQTALWKNLILYYYEAYDMAIQKVAALHINVQQPEPAASPEQIAFIRQQSSKSKPNWTRIMVERSIPERLKPLEELTRNLWWSWTMDGRSIFENIDYDLWKKSEKNPIAFLDKLTQEQFVGLVNNPDFLQKMDSVYEQFKAYMARKEKATGPLIAYFCMEYGVHSSLKIYSGGLGILAGDYLKETSDQNMPMVAVGLLYRYGYFTQRLSSSGDQEESYEPQNFDTLPISPVRDVNGEWVSVKVAFPGRHVTARIWRCDVGCTELYLLDTDHNLNLEEDRSITHYLYGGDWENRLKQEIVLGIGGIKALKELGIDADVYHCNEGHAAFIGIQRIIDLVEQQNLTFGQALEVVRSSSLFTTHTPVPAGHDMFSEDMMRQYMSQIPTHMKITWEEFISLGHITDGDDERFSMSYLACNLSQETNGVSWLHGEITKDIFGGLWPGYLKSELHIGYVTNGVHLPTWAAYNIRNVYNQYFGKAFAEGKDDHECWKEIHKVSDDEIWALRIFLKNKLVNYIKDRVSSILQTGIQSPRQIIRVKESFKADVLTIGFARRFATYKRAYLLFSDLDRLNKIVNNPQRPVQLLFAGKAHPADQPGQDIIKQILEVAAMPRFAGKILFLQNYDMELARRMVQGVDVWLNTPVRTKEASGTSGEKAVMNGVLHFSILDGWWVEGYRKGGGWMLPMERTFDEQGYQDDMDAEMIYDILEEEIVPLYYGRNNAGIPEGWIQSVKTSIAEIASNFTTTRMVERYKNKFYTKLAERNASLVDQNYALAREISAWKTKVSGLWDKVSIVDVKQYDMSHEAVLMGEKSHIEVSVYMNGLSSDDLGMEMIVADRISEKDIKLVATIELPLLRAEGNIAKFAADTAIKQTGTFDIAIRLYPKNPNLPHRMDFGLVKWA